MFDVRHCVAMLLTTYFLSHRCAVHNVCVVHVHIFFSYRVAVHIVGCASYVAQVYTRDATHRPTATWTPGRGASPLPTFSGNSGKFGKFGKKVKKVEKSRKKGASSSSWKGVFGGFFSLFFGNFGFFSKKVRFSRKTPKPPKTPKNPLFHGPASQESCEAGPKPGQNRGSGGGRFATFGNLNRWSLDQLLYGPRFRSS